MTHIKVLPPDVIGQIAAGEVIQRPAHVVKELIENAVDAKASRIEIDLKESGLSQIQITDNGIGIPQDELKLALCPHATSKLTRIGDLENLFSFGFRGEAMASICQVSQVELKSRTPNSDFGYQISSINVEKPPTPVGMNPGTVVTVTQLFANSPVRQDFLRRSKSELRKIIEVFTQFALIYPKIGFSLSHNNRLLAQYEMGQTSVIRTQLVLGNSIFSQLIPIQAELNQVSLSGFISQPSLWHKTSQKQFLFINNRPVTHRYLQQTLRQKFQAFQVNKFQPVYVLDLKLPPNLIDPNIHPQKQTIEIFDLKETLELLDQAFVPLLKHRPISYSSAGGNQAKYMISDIDGPYAPSFRLGLSELYQNATVQSLKQTGPIEQIGQVYLLTPINDGIFLIDQHALDERILYDQLMDQFNQNQANLMAKKKPVHLAFDVDLSLAQMIESQLEVLTQLGIEIEPFGNQSFKITSVPQIYADHDILELISEVLLHFQEDNQLRVDTQTEKIIASMACRMAVKAGDYLSPEKRQELVDALLSNKYQGTCPHGRPVAVKLTVNELHKLFKRV